MADTEPKPKFNVAFLAFVRADTKPGPTTNPLAVDEAQEIFPVSSVILDRNEVQPYLMHGPRLVLDYFVSS